MKILTPRNTLGLSPAYLKLPVATSCTFKLIYSHLEACPAQLAPLKTYFSHFPFISLPFLWKSKVTTLIKCDDYIDNVKQVSQWPFNTTLGEFGTMHDHFPHIAQHPLKIWKKKGFSTFSTKKFKNLTNNIVLFFVFSYSSIFFQRSNKYAVRKICTSPTGSALSARKLKFWLLESFGPTWCT
jgi:hypothetical protein